MIFHAADLDGCAIELFGNAAQIRVQRIPRGLVAQQRATVFGGKDQMNVNGGKGLWHDVNVWPNVPFASIPKGLCPSAQGWRDLAYLGSRSEMETTPTRLWPLGVDENRMAATEFQMDIAMTVMFWEL